MKYRESGRFGDVLGTSSGLAELDSNVPAKLSHLGNWEKVGARSPAALRGAALTGLDHAMAASKRLHSLVWRALYGKSCFLAGRDSAWC